MLKNSSQSLGCCSRLSVPRFVFRSGWRIARITRFSQAEILTENPQRCKDLRISGPDRGTGGKADMFRIFTPDVIWQPGCASPAGLLHHPFALRRFSACWTDHQSRSRHETSQRRSRVIVRLQRGPAGDISVDREGIALNNARHAAFNATS
jgi:hypothetical protein